MDFRKVGFVLGRRRSARADGIAEVEGGQAGHDRVEVDDADGGAGAAVEQDVAHLRVVVRDPQRQPVLFEQIHQDRAVRLAVVDEPQLCRDLAQAARFVAERGFGELAVARGRIVKVRDRLVQRVRRVIGEHALESAERRAGLHQHLVGVGGLKGRGVRNVQRRAPVLAAAVHVVIRAVRCLEDGQRAAGGVPALRRELCGEKARDAEHVFHDRVRVMKDKPVDALQDVCAVGADDAVGVVDVSAAERGDGQNFAAEGIRCGGFPKQGFLGHNFAVPFRLKRGFSC